MLASVQSLIRVQLFATPWTAAHLASLSITNSRSLLKLMSIELVIPSNCLILCRPLLLLPSIFPSIRGFPNEWVLWIRWPKYWSFSFSISPSKEGLIDFLGCYSQPPEFPFHSSFVTLLLPSFHFLIAKNYWLYISNMSLTHTRCFTEWIQLNGVSIECN